MRRRRNRFWNTMLTVVCPVDASQPPAKVLYDIIAGVMTLDAWHDIEKMKI